MPKICDKCGEEIENENSKFCHRCGTKLKSTPDIDNKKNKFNISSMDNKKKMILGAIVIIAIVAVVGFTILIQTPIIEYKTINITNEVSINVPKNSTYEKNNTLNYYKSDSAEIILFIPPTRPVNKQTVDNRTGLTLAIREYEDPSIQNDSEFIGGKADYAINTFKKMNIDGVLIWYDEIENKYAIALNGGANGFYLYAESKNPHILAQIYKSINYKNT